MIWHREIIMDIKDLPNDAATGVRTLPVVFGPRRALALSLAPLLTAAGVAATASGTKVARHTQKPA